MLQQLAFIVAWLLGALVILLVLASSLRLLLAAVVASRPGRCSPPQCLSRGAAPQAVGSRDQRESFLATLPSHPARTPRIPRRPHAWSAGKNAGCGPAR